MNLPSHPVLGTVVGRHSVSRIFGSASRRRSYRIGFRYTVKTPAGEEISMTASEWDKQVYRLAPKDQHLLQPQIKVGAFVSYYHSQPERSGQWAGTVVKVTRDTFTISPEFLPGIEDKTRRCA